MCMCQMNKAVATHDASVMEEPTANYDFYAILGDSARKRHASPRETKFPQTTMSQIGWRLTKPGPRLEMFDSDARPIGDIYKTLGWPRDCQ